MCSPAGPSRLPFKAHLLTCGGVPQVHGAQSPVSPWLHHFATPRSVCLLATGLQAVTPYFAPRMYGCLGCQRCRAHATGWSLMGPPVLARRLPSRGAVAWRCGPLLPWRVKCPAGFGAALGAGWVGLAGSVTRLPPCHTSLASLAVIVTGLPVRVSHILACWYAISCGLCTPGAWSSYPSGMRHMPVMCLCVRAPAVFTPPPRSVARALRQSPHRALVGLFQVVGAPLRFLPESLALLAIFFRGGRAGSRADPCCFWWPSCDVLRLSSADRGRCGTDSACGCGARAWGPSIGLFARMPIRRQPAAANAEGYLGWGSSCPGDWCVCLGTRLMARALGVQPGLLPLIFGRGGCGCWRPLADRTAHALATSRCDPWRWHEDARGGAGAWCFREGCLGLGTLHPPAATTHAYQDNSDGRLRWLPRAGRPPPPPVLLPLPRLPGVDGGDHREARGAEAGGGGGAGRAAAAGPGA